ncbi:hypothetical protein Pan216_09560 [Planctomycetes bacterium Pan216]|uniref:Uncharacterized protein n=1 Tax=Kolteria novifilia TaxID=2527975 RepID=A0A518AZH4_9BACT|nr:hypothetical protein Pan216_09560 [Planctomycetes bacterium Pan216]
MIHASSPCGATLLNVPHLSKGGDNRGDGFLFKPFAITHGVRLSGDRKKPALRPPAKTARAAWLPWLDKEG